MMKTDNERMHQRRRGGPQQAHAPHQAEERRGGDPRRPGWHGRDHRSAGHPGHAGQPEHTFDGGRGWHGGPGDRPGGGRGGGHGFGGHGGRGGGHGRGGGARVGRGDVRAAALALLAEQPLHGYEIIQQIAERSGGAWRPSPGSVYPALQLLEDQGLVQSDQSEGRRVYHLTDAGRAYVQQHQAELAAAWTAVAETVDEGARELRGLLDQVGTALSQVAQVGTTAQIAAAKELLTATRRRLYGILADEPTSSTPADTERR